MMGGFFGSLFDIIFPEKCRLCGERVRDQGGLPICLDCWGKLETITPPFCTICGIPFTSKEGISHPCSLCLRKPPSFKVARAVGKYSGPLREAIIELKYKGRGSIARRLGMMMADMVARDPELSDIELLLPVPLHRSRMRERGFNQSELLAKAMGKELGIEVNTSSLIRARRTASQVGLGMEERIKNVAGAFVVARKDAIEGRSLALVDDVMTTGATANECSKTLVKGGARSVSVVVLAREVGES